MKDYRQPLSKRRRDSAYHTARYWTDPAYRLSCINRDRARRGLPPRLSIEEVPARCSWLRRDA
jgi:hypothetical protein